METLISKNGSALVFVKPICKNNDGSYEYDFYYSSTPDDVYGLGWDDDNPNAVDGEDLIPERSTYSDIVRVETRLPLDVIQENSCYSMEYAMNRIVALAWICIDNLETYPDDGRCVLMFATPREQVEELIEPYLFAET